MVTVHLAEELAQLRLEGWRQLTLPLGHRVLQLGVLNGVSSVAKSQALIGGGGGAAAPRGDLSGAGSPLECVE